MTQLETLEREIARLEAEIARVERAPKSFDEEWAPIVARMDAAEQMFRQHGMPLDAPLQVSPEYGRQRQLSLAGAVLAGNRKAVEAAERLRIKPRTEGGLSTSERTRKLADLRAELLRIAERREIALRKVEGDDFLHPGRIPGLTLPLNPLSSDWRSEALMDSGTVKKLCDSANTLIPQLTAYGATPPADRPRTMHWCASCASPWARSPRRSTTSPG